MNPDRWHRIDELFAEALDHEPGKRSAFLAVACGSDSALRSEVEDLLRFDARAQTNAFLTESSSLPDRTEPPEAKANDANTMSASSLDTDDLPRDFGRYRILQKIGQGGMGIVYRAEDTTLGRIVALKVPHSELEHLPDTISRFQREARTAATLDHPSFCRIYDVGEIQGRHYIAMAYVEGKPLSTLIGAERPMDQSRAAAWVLRLALVLAQAHQRGIVHRDLKPSNIMIDLEGEPVIMDFGLARRFGAEAPELTQSGLLLGSPHYMAPEQVEGPKERIGPACDVYSLGVILYEFLSGQRPFRGSALRVLNAILEKDPVALSALRPGIDPSLERICKMAMARNIDDRYRSMTEFAEALSKWLAKHQLTHLDGPEDDHDSPVPPRSGKQVPADNALANVGISKLRMAAILKPKIRHAMLVALVCLIGLPLVLFLNRGDRNGQNQSTGLKMVRIAPGQFLMGSPSGEGVEEECPQHLVQLTRPFFLSAREVTSTQYHAVMSDDPSLLEISGGLPITDVSWADAIRFCNKLSAAKGLPPYYRVEGAGDSPIVTIIQPGGPGYRLPTEAEWEYACRAGSTTSFPFGNDESNLEKFAWYKANSLEQAHEVGVKKPNAWGLYDMLGNVWEWCEDGYDIGYYANSPPSDPRGPEKSNLRVVRGGSIFDDQYCRSAARQGHPPETRLAWFGFRVAAFQE